MKNRVSLSQPRAPSNSQPPWLEPLSYRAENAEALPERRDRVGRWVAPLTSVRRMRLTSSYHPERVRDQRPPKNIVTLS